MKISHPNVKSVLCQFYFVSVAWIGLFFPICSTLAQSLDSSHLPIVIINTEGATIEDDPKISVRMGIIDNPSGINHPSDPFNDYDGIIGIEFRGNSTQQFEKKSYSIELWDEQGRDQDASLLGMPEEEDWILYGSPIDKTHIRNVLSFELWRKMDYWASRTRYCELLLDGEYQGIYVLMEKIKRDAMRLDIAKLTENDLSGDDLTGGYIIRMDWPEDDGWLSQYKSMGEEPLFFQYSYPKAGDILPAQQGYIEQYINQIEQALFSPTFVNQKGIRYSDLMDIQTFADLFIINELSRSVDAYKLSSFIHKDKNSNGGLLKAGPIWDFNLAYGNTLYCGGTALTGWTYLQEDDGCEDLAQMPLWWERMMADCVFRDTLNHRWQQHRTTFLNEEFLFSFIDEQVLTLGESVDRNFDRWASLGENQWDEPEPLPNSYIGEINRLKNWLSQRINWMDQQLQGDCVSNSPIPPAASPVSIFPNPTQSILTIRFEGMEDMTVELYDHRGRIMKHIEGVDDQLILNDFGSYAAGVYLVSVSKGEFQYLYRVVKY